MALNESSLVKLYFKVLEGPVPGIPGSPVIMSATIKSESGSAIELVCPTLNVLEQNIQLCSQKQVENMGCMIIPLGKIRDVAGCSV